MGWESLVAIKVLETARPMRHSACGHPSGPAAVWPREQAGHTTASNDSRRSGHSLLASWGPSTHTRPPGRARHRPAAADGLAPAGAPQVAPGAGDPGLAGRAQALARQ